MVHIPESLVRSIGSGDCILWVGGSASLLSQLPPDELAAWQALPFRRRLTPDRAMAELPGYEWLPAESFSRPDSTEGALATEALQAGSWLALACEPEPAGWQALLGAIERAAPPGLRHYLVVRNPSHELVHALEGHQAVEAVPLPAEEGVEAFVRELPGRVLDGSATSEPELVERASRDLLRALHDVALVPTLAHASGLAVGPRRVLSLCESLGSEGEAGLHDATWVKIGNVLAAHGRFEAAAAAFDRVAAEEGSPLRIAACLGAAWVALQQGQVELGGERLQQVVGDDRRFSPLPERFALGAVVACGPGVLAVQGTDTESSRELELRVITVSPPLGGDEQRAFAAHAEALRQAEVAGIEGAFVEPHRVGWMLAADREPWSWPEASARTLTEAWSWIEPFLNDLIALHEAGAWAGRLEPRSLVGAAAGEGLRLLPSLPTRAPLGDPTFAAPEVLRGELPDARSDVYGAAAVIVWLLAGRPGGLDRLFAGGAAVDLRLPTALSRALDPQPESRGTVAELLTALAEVMASGVPATTEATTGSISIRIVLPEDPDDLEAWAAVLQRKPAHLDARRNLERLEQEAREQSRWDRLVEVLAVKADLAQAKQERLAHLREIARLYEERLGMPGSAFDSLHAWIDALEPSEQLEGLTELQRLAEATGKWTELTDVMVTVAGRLQDEATKAELWRRVGYLWAERLQEPDRALEAFESASALRPSAETWQAAIPIYRSKGDAPGLAAAYLSLADTQTGAERHASLLEAAEVLREDLGDLEGALDAVSVVLSESPEHLEALRSAESLNRALGRDETVHELLRRLLTVLPAGPEAERVQREVIDLSLAREDWATASRLAHAWVDEHPDDLAPVERLLEALRPAATEDATARGCLLEALERVLPRRPTAVAQAEVLAEIADLLDLDPQARPKATERREDLLALLPVEHPLAERVAATLEQGYRKREDFVALEELLLRQAQAEEASEGLQVEAWKKLLDLREGPLYHERGIVIALEELARLQPEEPRWRDALSRRFIERGDLRRAEPLLRAQLTDELDPRRKAELLEQLGQLCDKQGKTREAVEALEEAVALDPTRAGAWMELRELYGRSGQPLKAAEALMAAAEHRSSRQERAELRLDAAKRLLALGRAEPATELLERAVAEDPDHREATRLLLDRYVGATDLQRAWPHAQTYVTQVREQTPEDRQEYLRSLSLAGRCALAVGQRDRARQYLGEAQQLDASDPELVWLLGDLLREAERWSEALDHYRAVLVARADDLSSRDRARLSLHMAEAHLGLEELDQARALAEQAASADPDDRTAADLWLETAVAEPHEAARARRNLLALLERAELGALDEETAEQLRDERAGLLEEQAAAEAGPLGRPDDALRTYEAVLALRPEDTGVLHRVLDVLTQAERWTQIPPVLERLAMQQSEPAVAAKYLYAGAAILRDNLGDLATSAAWMRRVLDCDPTHQRAFDSLVEQCQREEAWGELSRIVRAHLKSNSKSLPPPRMVGLFDLLATAHERVGDEKTAIAALDQAARLAADVDEDEVVHRERHERIIRKAIQLGSDELDKAAHYAHRMIAERPADFETYHRLVEIYLAKGHRDRARVISRVLTFMRQADEAEEELARGQTGVVRGKVGRELWLKNVLHRSDDPRLCEAFSLVWPMVAAREGRTHVHHRVERAQRTEVSLQSPVAFARYLAYACQIFDSPAPDLFVRPKDSGGVVCDGLLDGRGQQQVVHPTVLVGRDALADHGEPALRFRAARAVARVRPEHLLASVLGAPLPLQYALWGAIRVAHPEVSVPVDAVAAAEGYAQHIRPYIPPAVLEQLRAATKPLLEEAAESDLRRWLQGVAFTANRAGFILCDSIDVAAQVVSREPDDGSGTSTKERIADLIGYGVSEAYLDLRDRLGV